MGMGAQEQGVITSAMVTLLNIVASAYISEKLISCPKQHKESIPERQLCPGSRSADLEGQALQLLIKSAPLFFSDFTGCYCFTLTSQKEEIRNSPLTSNTLWLLLCLLHSCLSTPCSSCHCHSTEMASVGSLEAPTVPRGPTSLPLWPLLPAALYSEVPS